MNETVTLLFKRLTECQPLRSQGISEGVFVNLEDHNGVNLHAEHPQETSLHSRRYPARLRNKELFIAISCGDDVQPPTSGAPKLTSLPAKAAMIALIAIATSAATIV